MKKVLITGAAGFLGSYLYRIALKKGFSASGTYNNTPGIQGLIRCDLTDQNRVNELVLSLRPDVIVHAAAISKVSDTVPYHHYHQNNTSATKFLARAALQTGCRLIYISTDLVYDGTPGFLRKEDYKLLPASSYALTKLEGESAVKDVLPPEMYLILRASLMYGFGGVNFFENSVNNLLAGRSVNLFTDQYRTPLYGKNAAEIILQLAAEGITGITLNMGGDERISRFDFMNRFAVMAGISQELLNPVLMASVPIPQVADVSMDITALKAAGAGIQSFDETFNDIVTFLRNQGKL